MGIQSDSYIGINETLSEAVGDYRLALGLLSMMLWKSILEWPWEGIYSS